MSDATNAQREGVRGDGTFWLSVPASVQAQAVRVYVSDTKKQPLSGYGLLDSLSDSTGIACCDPAGECCSNKQGFQTLHVQDPRAGELVSLTIWCPPVKEREEDLEIDIPKAGIKAIPAARNDKTRPAIQVVLAKPDETRDDQKSKQSNGGLLGGLLRKIRGDDSVSEDRPILTSPLVFALLAAAPTPQQPSPKDSVPEQAQQAYARGIDLLAQSRYSRAIAELLVALKALEPSDSPRIRFALGAAYSRIDLDESHRHLAEGLDLMGRLGEADRQRFEATFYHERARVNLKRDKFDEALEDANRALPLNQARGNQEATDAIRGTTARNQYLIAKILYSQKRLNEALNSATEALRVHDTLGSAWQHDVAADAELIGLIHSDRKQFEEAIQHMRKAQGIDAKLDEPNGLIKATSSDHLARILALRGRKRDRREALKLVDSALEARLVYFDGPIPHARRAEPAHQGSGSVAAGRGAGCCRCTGSAGIERR